LFTDSCFDHAVVLQKYINDTYDSYTVIGTAE